MDPVLLAALIDAVPFTERDTFKIVAIGPNDAAVVRALSEKFPRATIVDTGTAAVDSLTWWDLMFGAGLAVSVLKLDHLNDAKKQYLFKAAAERLSDRGAILMAERIPPQTLLHHLMWLKHAGFGAVDCYWKIGDRAVVGGVKQAAASAARLRADN
jgi:hypothetical protein